MSEWVGMHNPERHHPYGGRIICDWCSDIVGGGPCYDDLPCRCCLEAEVERLTILRALDGEQ